MVSHLGYHERILFAETSVVKLYIYKKTKLKKTAAIKDTTKKKQMWELVRRFWTFKARNCLA